MGLLCERGLNLQQGAAVTAQLRCTGAIGHIDLTGEAAAAAFAAGASGGEGIIRPRGRMEVGDCRPILLQQAR